MKKERGLPFFMDTIPLCLCIGLLLLLSGFFAATETAFSSLHLIRLKNMVAAGNRRAAGTVRLVERSDPLFYTLLLLNHLVRMLAAALATMLFLRAWGTVGIWLATLAMTVLLLLISEVTPRSLAKKMPERLAMFATPMLRVLIFVMYPFHAFFLLWRKLLARVLHLEKHPSFSEDELRTLVDEAQNEGGLDAHEGDLIRSAIEFNDMAAEEILTARVDMVAVSENSTPDKVEALYRKYGFSRFPVYRGSLDTIVGVIHEKDFFTQLPDTARDIRPIIKPVVFVSPGVNISALLRELQGSKCHVAVVVDEFGGTMGIVTLEDILEELVGDIWDEHDQESARFTRLPDGAWHIASGERLGEMFSTLGLSGDADDFDAMTVGGWASEQLGHLPQVGDAFCYENMCFSVVAANHLRVLMVEARACPAQEKNEIESKEMKRHE
ncbi:MAG: hemolysin family protein [Clostridia bacterium]